MTNTSRSGRKVGGHNRQVTYTFFYNRPSFQNLYQSPASDPVRLHHQKLPNLARPCRVLLGSSGLTSTFKVMPSSCKALQDHARATVALSFSMDGLITLWGLQIIWDGFLITSFVLLILCTQCIL